MIRPDHPLSCVLMATDRQALGASGEKAVAARVACPVCNRLRHLSRLPANFQCADLICRFCGYLAQVKAWTAQDDRQELPTRILGAAWRPQHEQILAGIFHGLYLVGFTKTRRLIRIDYVPAHVLQVTPSVFEPRAPLSATAKRAGWTGFYYNLSKVPVIGIERVV